MSLGSPISELMQFAVPDIQPPDQVAIERVLRSRWLTTGTECAALEEELSGETGAPYVVAVSSCTAALEIALTFLGLPPGSRIGVPSWTFVSTALAAHRTGGRIVLLDVDPDTLNVLPDSLEAALHSLDAVVPVHFAGTPVSPEVRAICADRGLPIVEDAAHAFGASDDRGIVNGKDVIAACYSFYATKNLTCGEGGAIATFDEELASFAKCFRLHGLSKDAWRRYSHDSIPDDDQYDLVGPGFKANLPDLLAALARSQLTRFASTQARRRALITRYREGLSHIAGVRVIPTEVSEGGADHLLVVALPERTDRAAFARHLAKSGIPTSVHFRPLHSFEWMTDNAEIGPSGVPVATSLSERVLSLPLHPALSLEAVDRVVRTVEVALQS